MKLLNNAKIVRDEDAYRVISLEDEDDPVAVAELHTRRRFRDNIHLQQGIVVPLDPIRITEVKASEEQVADLQRDGLIPEGVDHFSLPLPYTVHEGKLYVYGQNLQGLNREQLAEFFIALFEGLRELGFESNEGLKPVLIYNQIP